MLVNILNDAMNDICFVSTLHTLAISYGLRFNQGAEELVPGMLEVASTSTASNIVLRWSNVDEVLWRGLLLELHDEFDSSFIFYDRVWVWTKWIIIRNRVCGCVCVCCA